MYFGNPALLKSISNTLIIGIQKTKDKKLNQHSTKRSVYDVYAT